MLQEAEKHISPSQLNVEGHHFLVHRAVKIRQQSVLLWLCSYCKIYTIEAFSYNAMMATKKNLHPHLVFGCIRAKQSSLKLQLKFLYMLIFPMTFQRGFSTTSAKVSLEGICNGKFNCVANLKLCTLPKSIWGEHGSCWISPSRVKKPPLLHKREWSSLRNPFPALAMITISICSLLGRLVHML